jgi:hypothetical protein
VNQGERELVREMRAGLREVSDDIREMNKDNREFMRELNEGNREFMRELTVRHERSTEAAVRRLDDLGVEIRANTQILRDLHAETLAQRGGILKLIDRIDAMGAGGQG